MNREIKFKALTLENKLIEVGKIEFFVDGQIIVNDEIPVKKLIQFTGLKDKAGKEIFEGDIIDYRFVHEKGFEEKARYTVKFETVHGGFRLDGLWPKPYPVNDFYAQYCEIIGNFFENPELLK